MTLAEVAVPKELADELEESFYQGPMLDQRGTRLLNEELVARINKMSVVI